MTNRSSLKLNNNKPGTLATLPGRLDPLDTYSSNMMSLRKREEVIKKVEKMPGSKRASCFI